MEGIEFEESNEMKSFTSRKIFGELTVPKMARMFIKVGLAKNEKQAKYWSNGKLSRLFP